MSSVHAVPPEIMIHIFSFLSEKKRHEIMTVDKRTYKLMKESGLWKKGNTSEVGVDWYRRWRAEPRRKKGLFTLSKFTRKSFLGISHSRGAVFDMTMYKEGQLVTASRDTVRLWDVNARKEIVKFEGHKKAVYCVKVCDSKLVSGSEDGKVIFWNPHAANKNGLKVDEILNDETVVALQFLQDNKLCVAGLTKIKVWDLEKKVCETTLPNQDGLPYIGFDTNDDYLVTVQHKVLSIFNKKNTLKLPLSFAMKENIQIQHWR